MGVTVSNTFLLQEISARTTGGPSCTQYAVIIEALRIRRTRMAAQMYGTGHLVIGYRLDASAWPTSSQSHC